ncbi:MAG: nitrogenase component 1 [Puniceicoccales bacterium]
MNQSVRVVAPPMANDVCGADGLPASGDIPAAATRNACKLCSPLGASMVFKGIRGCLPFLHGSQGCATYIRRYMISHFREPVDIASSSFTEDDAIFGGAKNFADGLDNVIRQYHPEVIGVATTCLSETIGEHMIGMIRDFKMTRGSEMPLVHVSTPAYTGTHAEGFRAAVLEVVRSFVESAPAGPVLGRVNVLPGMMSCADLRHLAEICRAYELVPTLLPDYNETLEGGGWDAYHRISPGGTSLDEIRAMGKAVATVEFGHSREKREESAGALLESVHGIPNYLHGWPVGIAAADRFYASLAEISGNEMPEAFRKERSRLVDAYVDAHKYVSGKTAAVYGEPDLVVGMAGFLSEIGIRPIICATGSKVPRWDRRLASEIEGGMDDVESLSGVDHASISVRARVRKPDLLLGSSKGYPLARELGIPLLRIGFPLHDRFGGQRELSVGYRGTQYLFDRVVNALMEARQENNETGYSYL